MTNKAPARSPKSGTRPSRPQQIVAAPSTPEILTAYGRSQGTSLGQKVTLANRWRDRYNPLRGLSFARAVTLLESYYRGDMANLQWTYFFIEQTDPDLFTLCDRRTAAITERDWNIKTVSETKISFDKTLADEQAVALREAYERIDNLYETIEHFEMASFRGFSLAEKHHNDAGEIIHLEALDHWNVVRDGLRGDWRYNPNADAVTFSALPADATLDPANWIIRDTKRHINRIGLIKFLRQNLSQKDWDAFIETYGLPGVIIIAPPNVPSSKESEFEQAGKDIADGGSGTLPNGSEVHVSDGPRGVNPFRDHLRFLTEQLVLVGTGGLLTMLAERGSGTLAGKAHTETFETIASGEARKITNVFQKQFDQPILDQNFPGQPRLAYWELSAGEEVDVSAIVDQVLKLSQAGFQADPNDISEKTGYRLTLKPAAAIPAPLPPLANRGPGQVAVLDPATPKLIEASFAKLGQAQTKTLQPLCKRLEQISQLANPALQRSALRALKADLPSILKQINASPETAKIIEDTLAPAFVNGVVTSEAAKSGGTP